MTDVLGFLCTCNFCRMGHVMSTSCSVVYGPELIAVFVSKCTCQSEVDDFDTKTCSEGTGQEQESCTCHTIFFAFFIADCEGPESEPPSARLRASSAASSLRRRASEPRTCSSALFCSLVALLRAISASLLLQTEETITAKSWTVLPRPISSAANEATPSQGMFSS